MKNSKISLKPIGVVRDKCTIDGIDAHEETPVLDVKPYTGNPKDLVITCRTPAWTKKLHKYK